MQMATSASTVASLPQDDRDDATLFIAVGILGPLAALLIIYICYVCLKRRKIADKKNCATQQVIPSPSLFTSAFKQQLQLSPIPQGLSTGRISHGVSQADLKFVVPHYNLLQSEGDGSRSQSPVFTVPPNRNVRHQSAPVGPASDFSEVGATRSALFALRSRDSTPERPSSRISSCDEVHGICVQMYTSESDGDSTTATDSDERVTSRGKLCFDVEVDWLQGQLKVHLNQAFQLRSKSMKGSIHPLIRVSIHPDPKKSKFQTRLHNSANPHLDETFAFPLPNQTNSHEETQETECSEKLSHDISHFKDLEIRLTLFHCDIFSRKSEVGFISFQPFKDGPSVLPTSHAIFQTGGMEVWRDFKNADEMRQMQRDSSGQVLISLCRDPDKKTLSVGILKAKDVNIQQASSESSTLIYAKLSLVQGGKILKTKRTKTTKKQQNPSFNETFRFHIKTSWLDKISVTVSICAKNVLGSSKSLGRVTVGPVMYTCGAGLEHWNDMIAAPKSGVAQWHHIY